MTKNTSGRPSVHTAEQKSNQNHGFFAKYSKNISRAMKQVWNMAHNILATAGLATALVATDASAEMNTLASCTINSPAKERDIPKRLPAYLVRPEEHTIAEKVATVFTPNDTNRRIPQPNTPKVSLSTAPKIQTPTQSHARTVAWSEEAPKAAPIDSPALITKSVEHGGEIVIASTPVSPSKASAEAPAAIVTNKPRWAKVSGPTTVEGFMLEKFGVKTGWQNLVDMETGARVLNPNRDLRVGHSYFLANSEEEAIQVAADIKKHQQVAISKKTEKPATTPYIKPNEKNSFTVTRSNLSPEANDFLIDLAQKPRTIDQGKMYSLRIPDTEIKSIAAKVKLNEEEIPVVITLMSHIAKKESQWNYGAFGDLITHKSVHQGHRAIGITQIMPLNWINWSQKFYGKILDVTDTNQERVGFAQIAEYYRQSRDHGHKLPQILNDLAIAWYGSVKVKGLQTPTDYAQGFISSVYTDKTKVKEAEEIIAKVQSSLASKKSNTVAATTQKNPDIELVNYTQRPTSIVSQVTKMADSVMNTPAVNDPAYFKSSPVVSQGMSKVIELKSYLMKKKTKTTTEELHASNLTELGRRMENSSNVIEHAIATGDTRRLIEGQLQKGAAIKQSMELTYKIAPKDEIKTVLAQAMQETDTLIQNVVAFNEFQKKQEQRRMTARREENIAAITDARIGFAANNYRKAA